MTDPIRNAAVNLYSRMSERCDDIQMEAASDTWSEGATAWLTGIGNGTISQEIVEAHEEKTCKAILAELGQACLRRSRGLTPFGDQQ